MEMHRAKAMYLHFVIFGYRTVSEERLSEPIVEAEGGELILKICDLVVIPELGRLDVVAHVKAHSGHYGLPVAEILAKTGIDDRVKLALCLHSGLEIACLRRGVDVEQMMRV